MQLAYRDTTGQRRVASPDTLVAVLRALGEPIAAAGEAPALLEHQRARRLARVMAPTLVAWNGALREVELRLPSGAAGRTARLELTGPEGRLITSEGPALRQRVDPESGQHALVVFPGAGEALAPGAWSVKVEVGGVAAEGVALSAPERLPRPGEGGRRLGLFLPVHAMRSERRPDVGDLTDLGRLMAWAGGCGCDLFGVLPLLPTFLEPPAEPSPYAAATRLLPSELMADPLALGETGPNLLRALQRGGAPAGAGGRLVDYEAAWQRQLRLLRALAEDVQASDRLRGELEQFAASSPLAVEYAQFRARGAWLGRDWMQWPADAPPPGAEERQVAQAFLCGQWLAARQLAALDAEGRQVGCRLYADWPIGVHGRSFDVWRFRELFAEGVSVGAPPDDFSATGQDWGFAPMLPEVSRADGHAYFRRSLALQFEAAGAVRIDHVMGLHRLLWIPEGATGGAAEGVYVRQPVDELYACVMIEAARHQAVVIGENLGCVPAEVNRMLRRRGFLSMRVMQFEVGGEKLALLRPGEAALVSTHDTPTFAGFAGGEDIAVQQKLGRIDDRTAGEAQAGRQAALDRLRRQLGLGEGAHAAEMLEALLRRLAASEAACLIVSLEDLWLEPLPQNTPGTSTEMPNWQRRAARSVDEITEDEKIERLLGSLAALRRGERDG